jgi:hypothetical protein
MRSFLLGLVAGSGLTWAFMSLRRDHYRHEYSARRCGGGEIPLAQWEAMRTPFNEGPTQRGNGNGGPANPKPDIPPKPQPPGGRLIGPGGFPIGYQPRPSRPGANPPPSEP